ncbi:hypothetical protein NBRC10513_007093 [Rhodotorula toruloides]
MTSKSQIMAAFDQVPYRPHPDAKYYFVGLLKWNMEMPASLLEKFAALIQSGHGHGAIHFQALTTSLRECVRLVSSREIFSVNQLPTEQQLWDMVRDNYILPGNLMPNVGGLHSLLKPEIGRRVARMHGTTKARWERDAGAF